MGLVREQSSFGTSQLAPALFRKYMAVNQLVRRCFSNFVLQTETNNFFANVRDGHEVSIGLGFRVIEIPTIKNNWVCLLPFQTGLRVSIFPNKIILGTAKRTSSEQPVYVS